MSQLKKLFKFEMLGLSKGDHIIFDPPLGLEVTISSPNKVSYEWKDWVLSTFVKEFIPKRNASGNYQRPLF